jgi:hypothetical protein
LSHKWQKGGQLLKGNRAEKAGKSNSNKEGSNEAILKIVQDLHTFLSSAGCAFTCAVNIFRCSLFKFLPLLKTVLLVWGAEKF